MLQHFRTQGEKKYISIEDTNICFEIDKISAI
jgi:hypothetical protein